MLAAIDADPLTGFPEVDLCGLVVAKPPCWSCVYVSTTLDAYLPHSDATSIENWVDRALPRISNKGVCMAPTRRHRFGISEPSIRSKKAIKGAYHLFREMRYFIELGGIWSVLMKYSSS